MNVRAQPHLWYQLYDVSIQWNQLDDDHGHYDHDDVNDDVNDDDHDDDHDVNEM